MNLQLIFRGVLDPDLWGWEFMTATKTGDTFSKPMAKLDICVDFDWLHSYSVLFVIYICIYIILCVGMFMCAVCVCMIFQLLSVLVVSTKTPYFYMESALRRCAPTIVLRSSTWPGHVCRETWCHMDIDSIR